jgi:hypothetical protein
VHGLHETARFEGGAVIAEASFEGPGDSEEGNEEDGAYNLGESNGEEHEDLLDESSEE